MIAQAWTSVVYITLGYLLELQILILVPQFHWYEASCCIYSGPVAQLLLVTSNTTTQTVKPFNSKNAANHSRWVLNKVKKKLPWRWKTIWIDFFFLSLYFCSSCDMSGSFMFYSSAVYPQWSIGPQSAHSKLSYLLPSAADPCMWF